MSVTLVSGPSNFVPVYNPIRWVFLSTNYARCEFQYICDVYVNGSFAVRLKAEPEENTGYGTFNVQEVLQDFIDKDFKHDLIGFAANNDCSVAYYLEIREQYNSNYLTTCIGAKTLTSVQYTTVGSPAATWAWNGALQYKEYLDFKSASTIYFLNDYRTKFLNHTPNFLRVPFYQCEQPSASYTIDGIMYNGGLVDFEIDGGSGGVILANGTTFSYVIDQTAADNLGMAASGTGTITGYNGVSFSHQTDVVCTINVGSVVTGYMTTNVSVTHSNGWMVHGFLQDYTNIVADYLEVKTYDFTNTLLDTFSISNAVTSNEHIAVGVGPNNLNAWGEIQSPAVTVITSDVKYYSIQLFDNSNTAVSECKYLTIDSRETRFTKYRIHWLNTLGEYDSYTFDLLSAASIDSNDDSYTKVLQDGYVEGDRGQVVINVDAREKYKFQTNHLQREDAIWTKELFTSPDIYVVDDTPKVETFNITGHVHDSLTGYIDLVSLTAPAIGTKFKYILNLSSGAIQQFKGEGFVTGMSGPNIKTNVIIPGSSGAVTIEGVIYAEIQQLTVIPMVRISQNWDDRGRSLQKNITYSIDLMPSHKINTQSF